AIDDYIHYYNEQRIKVKLKGQTPSQFRSLSF
ncbi:MAG: IS3 family transposase, partial [Oscillospiraceae bacterium]|nr:IS3 family transposase [Oscillospiraceae bacterium]